MDEAALTGPVATVVNFAPLLTAAWTWTRGGWRERYPKELAPPARRRTWGDRGGIWADRLVDRDCGDGGHCRARRRCQRHVEQSRQYRPGVRIAAASAAARSIDDQL